MLWARDHGFDDGAFFQVAPIGNVDRRSGQRAHVQAVGAIEAADHDFDRGTRDRFGFAELLEWDDTLVRASERKIDAVLVDLEDLAGDPRAISKRLFAIRHPSRAAEHRLDVSSGQFGFQFGQQVVAELSANRRYRHASGFRLSRRCSL